MSDVLSWVLPAAAWLGVTAGVRGWLGRAGLVRCRAGDWGISFLAGFTVFTTLAFWAALVGVPIGWPLFTALASVIFVSGILAGKNAPAPPPRKPEPWTPAEGVLLVALAGYLVLSASSALYFPISATDAFSYDVRAKFMVAEKILDISYFHWPGTMTTTSSNTAYPPLFPLSLAVTYVFGGWQTKIVTLMFYTALPLCIFSVLRQKLPRFPSLLAALFVPLTPEIFSHASYALLNTPAATLALGEAVAVYRYTQERKRGWLVLAAVLAGGLTGLRPDGVVIHGAVGLAGFLSTLERDWKRIALWALLAAAPVLTLGVWTWYSRQVIGIPVQAPFEGDSVFGFKVMWFATPRMMIHTKTFSVMFMAWALTIPFAAVLVRKDRAVRFWQASALLGLLGIAVVFTQLSRSYGGGINEVLNSSFKRSLFYLVPVCTVAAFYTPPVRWAVELGNGWLHRSGDDS